MNVIFLVGYFVVGRMLGIGWLSLGVLCLIMYFLMKGYEDSCN